MKNHFFSRAAVAEQKSEKINGKRKDPALDRDLHFPPSRIMRLSLAMSSSLGAIIWGRFYKTVSAGAGRQITVKNT
jgi:hypothetical protein